MKYIYIFLILVGVVFIYGAIQTYRLPFANDPEWVIAFAPRQVEYLGLNAKTVWQEVLTDLKPKQVRLQANWNDIEKQSGQFDFSELDWYLNQAKESNTKVTLAVGRKLPRWPECHDPAWLQRLLPWEVEPRQLQMLEAVIKHYKNDATITRWQLENEPLFTFGQCPPPNWHRLKAERDLVKSFDPSRPILMTDSGELSPWLETSILADVQGTTMYRITWDKMLGYFHYFWPPFYYRFKSALISPFVDKTIISELQMEPWARAGLTNLSWEEAQESFSLEQFHRNVNFARQTGFSEAMVWGVEWWYQQKITGHPEYWKAGEELFGGN